MSTVASDVGMSSEPTCSGRQRERAARRASPAPVPTAPRTSDGMKPMNGSTSRRMAASRMARASSHGMTTALMAVAPTATSDRPHARPRGARASASAPSSTPCSAVPLMTARSRLVPSRKKFEQEDEDEERIDDVRHRIHLEAEGSRRPTAGTPPRAGSAPGAGAGAP